MSKTTSAQSDNSSTVTVGDVVIAGQSYAPDATVTVMGKTFTVVGSGRFAASRNSGLSAGDYPVVFGTLFLFTLLGLVVKLIGDLTYTLVDPRIDFESREG